MSKVFILNPKINAASLADGCLPVFDPCYSDWPCDPNVDKKYSLNKATNKPIKL